MKTDVLVLNDRIIVFARCLTPNEARELAALLNGQADKLDPKPPKLKMAELARMLHEELVVDDWPVSISTGLFEEAAKDEEGPPGEVCTMQQTLHRVAKRIDKMYKGE